MSVPPATEVDDPFVLAEGLRCHFAARPSLVGGGGGDAVRAVDEVSLAIPRGGALGLVGESGCGKTTLARALLRLIEPGAGRVRIDGVDLASLDGVALRRFRSRAQLLFQDAGASLDPRWTAFDSIAEPLRLHAVVAPAAVAGEVARLLAAVHLDAGLADRYPHQLSGGQRQRVALARALACRPALLIADEPMSGLDPTHRLAVADLLAELRAALGLTLLLISHDLRAVRRLCERVAVMHQGRVVEEGAVAEVLDHPRHPCTAALLAAAPPWPPAPPR